MSCTKVFKGSGLFRTCTPLNHWGSNGLSLVFNECVTLGVLCVVSRATVALFSNKLGPLLGK